MRMQIIATTDGRFLGHEFDDTENPITLSEDVEVAVERRLTLPDGIRFISSNYIIDAREV